MKNLEKLMQKKKDSPPMDEQEKSAKMSMLQALRKEMSDMMKDDLTGHSMKKVEIAGKDDADLKMGLDKAKDMLDSGDDEDMEEDKMSDGGYVPEDDNKDWEDEEKSEKAGLPYDSEAMGEHEEDADSEDHDLSEEEMEHLERLLAKMKKSKK